jgi:hypothetical protein
MNGRRAKYASAAAAIVLVAAGRSLAAPTPTADAIDAAERPAPLPTFASIPPAPTDLRPFAAWRSAIIDIKSVGARIAAEAAVEPWTLAGTEAWADRARDEAAPPPPMTTPSEGDTEAFVKAMRERATPPPRTH